MPTGSRRKVCSEPTGLEEDSRLQLPKRPGKPPLKDLGKSILSVAAWSLGFGGVRETNNCLCACALQPEVASASPPAREGRAPPSVQPSNEGCQ